MHRLLKKIANSLIFSGPNKVMYDLFKQYGIPHNNESLFDIMIRKSDLLLQSGTPGFEYNRSDLSLFPATTQVRSRSWSR